MDALRYLYGLVDMEKRRIDRLFTPEPKLERVSDLLTRLGNPYQAYPTFPRRWHQRQRIGVEHPCRHSTGRRAGQGYTRRHTCIPTASASRSTVTPSHAGVWPTCLPRCCRRSRASPVSRRLR